VILNRNEQRVEEDENNDEPIKRLRLDNVAHFESATKTPADVLKTDMLVSLLQFKILVFQLSETVAQTLAQLHGALII
jgi:hypothetical protein